MKHWNVESIVDGIGKMTLVLMLASLVSACASTKPRVSSGGGDCVIVQTGRQSYRCEPTNLTRSQRQTVNKLSRELASRGTTRKARGNRLAYRSAR